MSPINIIAMAYTLVKLAATSAALCLDGSPGAFYIQKSATGSSQWQLFAEGGGWCWDAAECAQRATTDLGSSLNYSAVSNNPGEVGGITSSDCSINPTFCSFNKVYM